MFDFTTNNTKIIICEKENRNSKVTRIISLLTTLINFAIAVIALATTLICFLTKQNLEQPITDENLQNIIAIETCIDIEPRLY